MLGGQLLALGEQQRQQPEPLLAARAVRAQLAALAAEAEVVAMRPVAGEPALEVRVVAFGQFRLQRLGRARSIPEIDLALKPEAGRMLGEPRAQPLDRPCPIGHQRHAVAGQLRVPGR